MSLKVLTLATSIFIVLTNLSILFLSCATLLHPFHVSVCSINHAPDQHTLQITLKVFADDLEEALNQQQAASLPYVDVLNPAEPEVLEAIIQQYLEQRLTIIVDGKVVHPVYLGYEREDLALWCYFEVGEVDQLETIAVRNSVLVETFSDQTNIVHIQYNGTTKSMKLAKDQLQDQLTF